MSSKVAVVGVGGVGQACAFALVLRGSAREVMLVDRTPARATGVATDMRYGLPLTATQAIGSGDWSDLGGADVVLICAGLNEKGGGATDRDDVRGRLRLLEKNAEIYRDRRVTTGCSAPGRPSTRCASARTSRRVAAAPDAVLLAVTDPPDPLTRPPLTVWWSVSTAPARSCSGRRCRSAVRPSLKRSTGKRRSTI